MIDDADDACVGRAPVSRIKRKARFLPAHEEHGFSNPGAHGINRHERSGRPLSRRPPAAVAPAASTPSRFFVFSRGDDVANDSPELHRLSPPATTIDRVDNADDRCVNSDSLSSRPPSGQSCR